VAIKTRGSYTSSKNGRVSHTLPHGPTIAGTMKSMNHLAWSRFARPPPCLGAVRRARRLERRSQTKDYVVRWQRNLDNKIS